MSCYFPPLALSTKAKATLFAIAFLFAGTLAAAAFTQDISVLGEPAPEIGRLSDLQISAELEKDDSKIPADSILVDVEGDCDYRLYEQSTKVAFVPLSKGVIKVKVVAIWFDLRIATQTIERIQIDGPVKPVPDPGPSPDPDKPDPSKPDLSSLTAFVTEKSDAMKDEFVAEKLKVVYAKCSEAVLTSTPITIDYFNDKRTYTTETLDDCRSAVNNAVSRTIAFAKATNPASDSKDWSGGFLVPLKERLDQLDLSSREALSDALVAVAQGL